MLEAALKSDWFSPRFSIDKAYIPSQSKDVIKGEARRSTHKPSVYESYWTYKYDGLHISSHEKVALARAASVSHRIVIWPKQGGEIELLGFDSQGLPSWMDLARL